MQVWDGTVEVCITVSSHISTWQSNYGLELVNAGNVIWHKLLIYDCLHLFLSGHAQEVARRCKTAPALHVRHGFKKCEPVGPAGGCSDRSLHLLFEAVPSTKRWTQFRASPRIDSLTNIHKHTAVCCAYCGLCVPRWFWFFVYSTKYLSSQLMSSNTEQRCCVSTICLLRRCIKAHS